MAVFIALRLGKVNYPLNYTSTDNWDKKRAKMIIEKALKRREGVLFFCYYLLKKILFQALK